MHHKHMKNVLRFDFENNPVCFEHPVDIITTHKLTEITDCFERIEKALAQGFYVAGYLAYEAAPAFEIKMPVHKPGVMPLLWFGVYQEAKTAAEIKTQPLFHPEAYQWATDTSESDYTKAIEHIHHAIQHGDTYQINYTIRLSSSFNESAPGFYQHLKQAQQSDYCAYLDIGDFQIISASPELFFKRDQDKLTTRPMKGTMPRGMTPDEDIKNKETLTQSEKDQAENIMIVDLLRNDLSQLAQTGSVKVTKLFEIEQYPSVWQMTSTVEASLKEQIDYFTIFKALFPCGSITGAPKISAMKTIAQLEKNPREVYCGAIGYFTPDRKAIFNVPIRTVFIDQQQKKATYAVGGGITWYSTAQGEYQEALDKAKIVLSQVRVPKGLLESFLIEEGQIFLKEAHIERLKNSCAYFLYPFPEQDIEKALRQLVQQYTQGTYKGRLLLDKTGKITVECTAITPLTTTIKASWAPEPIQSKNALYYHKTTERQIYPVTILPQEYLLYNEKGQITEFTNGNVALLINDQWFTPPVTCGLLNGTLRAQLIKQGKLTEKILYKEEFDQATSIAFINSVRGWIEVEFN